MLETIHHCIIYNKVVSYLIERAKLHIFFENKADNHRLSWCLYLTLKKNCTDKELRCYIYNSYAFAL